MEPEIVELEAAVKALTVLSAIPIVLYALWADYFERYINELCIKTPQFDRNVELEKVRIASLCVVLFLFSLYIGSPEIRRAYPLASQLVFCVGTFLQLWLQSRLEKKISSSGQKIDYLIGIIGRATAAWLGGAALYILTVFIFMRFSIGIAQISHASQNTSTVIFFFGGIAGVLAGLGVNFALAPFFIKKVLPISPITDQNLQNQLDKCYSKAKFKAPQFWLIDLYQFHIAYTINAGLQFGKGLFRPAFFLARSLLDLLSQAELEAVILNQISHVTLKHVKRRFVLTFSLILLTTLTAVGSAVFARFFLPGHVAFESVGPLVAIACFFASFKLLTEQIKKHQFEADIYTIEKLGVDPIDFFSSLRKLDRPKNPDTSNKNGFPETERRIKLVQEYLKLTHSTSTTETEELEKKAS